MSRRVFYPKAWPATSPKSDVTNLGPIVEVTVVCSDVAATERLLCTAFDWTSVAGDSGMVVTVEGQSAPRIRLVPGECGSLPEPASEPEPWEPGLRMLSVYSRDPAETAARVAACGGRPGPVYTWEAFPGVLYSDCIARGTDGLFLVFPRSARPLPSPAFSQDPNRLHGELHNVTLTVPDFYAAIRFFCDAGGMDLILEKVVAPGPDDQPELKKMVGLPQESIYYVALLGTPDRHPARLEINAYQGVPEIPPTQREHGLKRITFSVPFPPAAAAALLAGGASLVADSPPFSIVTWSNVEIGLLRADLAGAQH